MSMVVDADKCVGLMDRLEWLYFDQYPMAVRKVWWRMERSRALCQERNACATLLDSMFG